MGERWAGIGAGGGGRFSADAHLTGVLRRLLAEGRDACIALAGGGEVAVLPGVGRYVSLVSDMAAFCRAPSHAFETAPLASDSIAPGAQIRDIDELHWHAGFHASQGRLLDELSEYDVVQFTRWPNFSRLPHTPNAMRICALLVNHPTSIMMARRRLRVDAEEIYRVYVAAYAAGIAKVLNRKSTESAAEPAQTADASDAAGAMSIAGPPSILGMLFGRLSSL